VLLVGQMILKPASIGHFVPCPRFQWLKSLPLDSSTLIKRQRPTLSRHVDERKDICVMAPRNHIWTLRTTIMGTTKGEVINLKQLSSFQHGTDTAMRCF
jgi:hypothetical protein